jgi:uncharacterized membrane protein
MSTYRLSTAQIPQREYTIPSLPLQRPLQWLKQGWADFAARPMLGLSYGLLVAVVGFLLTVGLISRNLFHLVPVFTAGFFLISPVLAVGLYADARKRQVAGIRPNQKTGWFTRRNLQSISEMGIMLMLIFLNWIMLSNLMFAGVFSELLPTWQGVKPLSVMWTQSWPFVAVYFGIGALLAGLVFRMAAVSIPMMVDQEIDTFNAIFASWKAVGENWRPMTLWAALIVGLCVIGFATLFLGFILVIPVLGYASWHAYRDLLLPHIG